MNSIGTPPPPRSPKHNLPYKKIALIGLGLIASSIALALRRAAFSGEITGHDSAAQTRSDARARGFCDSVYDRAADAVFEADLVLLCVPVGAMAEVAQSIAPKLKAGAIISDVGSVKKAVVDAVCPHVPDGVHFIPAHPLAGTEHSGPNAGFATLFDNRWCIITPLHSETDTHPDNLASIKAIEALWQALGAQTARMSPERHDMVLAIISHVPHLIAYTIVGVADDLSRISGHEIVNYSAAGFRDFTRIAASNPIMWRDVFLNNKEATLEILGRFTEELFALQRHIRTDNAQDLFEYFTRTRDIRRNILEAGQDVAAPDFGRNKKEP